MPVLKQNSSRIATGFMDFYLIVILDIQGRIKIKYYLYLQMVVIHAMTEMKRQV
jgi:hypothetical protein